MRYDIINTGQKLLRDKDKEHHLFRRTETCTGKSEGYLPVPKKLFIFDRLFAAFDGTAVYLPVCVDIMEKFFISGMDIRADTLKFVHTIPLSAPNACYFAGYRRTNKKDILLSIS